MSALPPKADIGTQRRNVCFVPKADIGASHRLRGRVLALASMWPCIARSICDFVASLRSSVISSAELIGTYQKGDR